MSQLAQVAMRQISSVPFRGVVVVDSSLDHFLENDGDPDALFQHSGSLLKASSSTRSALVNLDSVSGDVESKSLYVKEFRYKGLVHSLKHLFGKHRAQVMWKVSWHLLKHSIPVPKPEGYLLRQKGPICLSGYYFSKALRRCSSLHEFAEDLDQLNQRLDSGGLSRVAAHSVAALHDSGATHGDLKWTNILVDEKENQLWLTDLDASNIYGGHLGPKRIARDLARFILSGLEAGVDGKILARFLGYYARRRNLKLKDLEGPMMNVLLKLRKRHERKLQNMRR
ncbi:MAG: lipopolysaccharide kinase InaA family protein [Syntrophobacterales bacterium]|jgi:serine/threonine protein kinase